MNKINIPQYIASLGAHVYMDIAIATVVSISQLLFVIQLLMQM